MSFAGLATWQAWLLLSGAGALAAGLFLLKLRPPRLLVASLLLWRRVLDQSREQTLWERVRRAVSLVVTVLVALALALAVAQPARRTGKTTRAGGRTLVVIDSSWSMLARTPSGETRWERAIAEARRLAAAASGSEVALATTADGVVEGPTTDLALVQAGLDRIAPRGADATSWPGVAGADVVHFISDGAVARSLDPAVVVHSVFEFAANVAITAFDVRPSLVGVNAGDAYLEMANFAPAAQKVRVTLTRGTAKVFDRTFDMAPGEAVRQVMPIARGSDGALRARVEAPDNALEIDDEAFAWVERARPVRVTVVGGETRWLRALLERDADVQATFVEPSAYRAGDEGVVIFDRWAPNDPPPGPAMFFAPPPDTTWLAGGAEELRPRWEVAGEHPVVLGVDPFTLTIQKARAYKSTALVPVARSARGTPLVYVGESAGRLVVVTFGSGESNLASAPGFPVLVGNALAWLARPLPTRARRPGLVPLDASVSKVTRLDSPAGRPGGSLPIVRVNATAITDLFVPGLYVAEGAGAHSTIAVNAGDAQISNLMRTSLASGGTAQQVAAGRSERPWWVYCAAFGFALALAEWWTWQRRITV